jgi:hypothetical protein
MELSELKTKIKEFRNDKTKYDNSDILAKMRNDIYEAMAIAGYQSINDKDKTVEDLFVDKLTGLINNSSIKEFNGTMYVNLDDLRNALETIRLTSI